MADEPNYPNPESSLRSRDLEQSQKLMKERVLLIGRNLIEFQEKNSQEITEIKKRIQNLESDVEQIKNRFKLISEEVSKSARKEEVAILERQAKMFEPLKLARIKDIEKIVEKKLEEKNNPEEKERNFWKDKI